jgi:hypothetical protein
MISFTAGGSTANTDRFLSAMIRGDLYSNLESFAQRGVDALRAATPVDSGLTAESWTFEIEEKSGSITIWWLNENVVNGFNVAIGLQYGHGTGTGGWVQGYDYINPALRPIFDEIADNVWKEVQKA